MNRRKAIGRIFWTGTAAVGGYMGFRGYQWYKKPDFAFLDQHKDLLAALADTIIPPTDTPGAAEAGVADYILVMLKDCRTIKAQNKFIDGLKDLDSYSHSTFQKGFVECSTQQRNQVMAHFQEKGLRWKGINAKIQDYIFEKPFFRMLVELTVEGYCTSELGANKGLAYTLIPGKYQGCIPMRPGQHSWATK